MSLFVVREGAVEEDEFATYVFDEEGDRLVEVGHREGDMVDGPQGGNTAVRCGGGDDVLLWFVPAGCGWRRKVARGMSRGDEPGRSAGVVAGQAVSCPDSATRRARDATVSAGFTAAEDGKGEESTIQRLSTSWDLQYGSTTLVAGSTPMRAVPHWWDDASMPRSWVRATG